jgi:pimeloyl-ACP methyl ester carboxylesterase
MEHITSGDGTRIAFWRSGTGPPLLLVHGTTYDHTTAWRFVVPELERRFTVYAMNRRGRGGSEILACTSCNERRKTWPRSSTLSASQ